MSRIVKPSGRKNRKERLVSYGRHLVYAEGEKTEPLYVANIAKIVKQNYYFHNTEIVIENVSHGGFNTKGLVEFAEEDVKRRKKNGEAIDHVWVFFDKDSFPKDDFDNSHNKIECKNKTPNDDGDLADQNGICWHSIWSNECFEIWIILHFEYLTSSFPRDRYMSKINSEYLCSNQYQKNRIDLYDLLSKIGDVKMAISNAKKLFNDHKTANPSTGVYRFLEYFDKYLNKP